MVLRRRRGVQWLPGFLLVALLVFILRTGWLERPQSMLVRAVAPITGGVSSLGEAALGFVRSFFRIGTLSRAVRILEEENARLRSSTARLHSLEEENARLREQLQLLPRARYQLVSADVVGRSTDGISETFIINRGTNDGLQSGMPVIVSGGIVVGSVRSVQTHTASVALLTDSSFRAAGETLGTRAEGLVHGVRGIEIVMDTIPRTSEVRVGDSVVTTGTDGLFPPHLLLGTIHAVSAPENEIFQTAQLVPAVQLRQLRVVSIIRE